MAYSVDRILDANINRAKEGLRVAEEICRFILNNKAFTAELKKIRHDLDGIFLGMPGFPKRFLKERESAGDVGRKISAGELKRGSVRDIFFANMQRVKESVRVLEEFSKLTDAGQALKFKRIRYRVYITESKIGKRL